MNKDDTIYFPESNYEREVLKVEGISYFRGYKCGKWEKEQELKRAICKYVVPNEEYCERCPFSLLCKEWRKPEEEELSSKKFPSLASTFPQPLI